MSQTNNETLKGYFITGAKPTQAQFHQFIDELDRYSGSISSLDSTSASLQRYNVDSGSFNANIGNRLLTSVYTTDSASFSSRLSNVTVTGFVSESRYNTDSGSFNTNINNRLLTSTFTTNSASFSASIATLNNTSASLQRYNVDSGSFNANILSISSSAASKQDRFQGTVINNSQSVIIDFNTQYHSIFLSSTASFSTTNLGPNRFAAVRLVTSQSSCLFNFPANWSWMNTLPPVSQSNNTNGILSFISWGTTNGDVQVAYSVRIN